MITSKQTEIIVQACIVIQATIDLNRVGLDHHRIACKRLKSDLITVVEILVLETAVGWLNNSQAICMT
jgi:hypothetical protein